MKRQDISQAAVRARLTPRREPRWTRLQKFGFLGYRRTQHSGHWIARWHGKTHALRQVPDGDYDAAEREARVWFLSQTGDATEYRGTRTVTDVCRDHAKQYKIERGTRDLEDRTGDIDGRFKHVYESDLGKVDVRKLDATQLRKFRNDLRQKMAGDSVNRIFADVRAALNGAFDAGQVPSDAAWRRTARLPTEGNSRDRYLEKKERRAITKHAYAISQEFGDFVVGLQVTAARMKELRLLKVERVDLRLRAVDFSSRKGGKGKRTRLVHLGPKAFALFKRLVRDKERHEFVFENEQGDRWTKNYNRVWRRCITDAGLYSADDKVDPYHLRHSTIADWLMAGTDLQTVSKASGTSMKMLEDHYSKYIESAAKRLAAIDVL